VHFARDVELGRDLAIELLRPEYQTRPTVVQRFLQEARAAPSAPGAYDAAALAALTEHPARRRP